MLIRDKYQPKKLSEYLIHKNLTRKLENFFIDKDIPNLILYGPYGSGKFSIAKSIIMEIFGKEAYNIKNMEYAIKISNNTKLINIKYSNFHYEILINKYVFNDRNSLITFIKDISNSKSINTNSYNIIIIRNIDLLNRSTLTFFKRGIEQIFSKIRIIGTCTNLSKIKPFIGSNFFCIRVSLPSNLDLKTFIKYVNDKEDLKLSKSNIENCIKYCYRNINKILINLEDTKYNKTYKKYNDMYYYQIKEVCELITKLKVGNILLIREKLYKLSSINIDVTLMLKTITQYFLNLDINLDKKNAILEKAIFFDIRLVESYKELIHLEAFIISIMEILVT